MDPNENIKRQRELAAKLLDGDLTHEEVTDAAMELAELVQALDEWRRSGGFDPYGVTLTRGELFVLAGRLQEQWEYLEEIGGEPEEAAHLKARSRELFALGETRNA